jgi:hypothetical protein
MYRTVYLPQTFVKCIILLRKSGNPRTYLQR